MLRFAVRRLLFAIPTLFAVMTMVFVLVRIVPGDPAQTILGDQASAEALQIMRERLGLDRPLWEQYFEFMGGALTGDWGQSMVTGKPVLSEILRVLPYTLELTVASLVIGALIGVPLGAWSAIHRNRWIDYVTRVGSLLGLSFPAFVSAILLLMAFSIQLRWFPVISGGGRETFSEWALSLALPAINLGLIMAAYITRVTRSSMLGSLGEDYIRTARAKGVPIRVIVWRHALRNALIPVMTIIGLQFSFLLAGAI
ncbi:MAG: glutathione ABC transporter permease, partial [Rhodobacterales bacterium 32-67-9]